MKIYIIAAAVALTAIAGNGMLNRIQHLSAANETLQGNLQRAEAKATGYEVLIQQLAADLAQQRETYAKLQRTQTSLNAASSERAATIRRLQRENQELKNWAAVELPDSVKCLRSRPAITSAADYSEWLSSSNALPAACQ